MKNRFLKAFILSIFLITTLSFGMASAWEIPGGWDNFNRALRVIPDGTSTAPAWAFKSEPTLGFYRSGSGVISLAGGTLSMLGGTYILSNADVAHGMTTVTATTNYGLLSAISGTDGGLSIQGLSDTDAIPLYIRGVIGSTNPTDTLEAISIVGAKKNGTGVQALGASETVLQILNNTTELFTQTGDGSYRQPASTYHNFGATIGTGGYGIYDNAGTLQFKNSGGAWADLVSAVSAGGWQDDGGIVRLITGADNVGVNATAAGTSATSTMVFGQWTEPTTSPADVAQLGAADMQSAPGMTRLHQRTEAGITSPLALHDEGNALANPRSPSQAINMLVAASGSTGITTADNANLDFGTGNFTLAFKGSIPDWTPDATVVLAQKTDGTNGWNLQVLTTGIIRLTINVTNYDSTVAPVITNGMVGKIGVSVTRETASVAGSVVFYFNGTQLGASVAITAGTPTTVNNAVALYVLGTSLTRTAGQFHFFAPYNRTLSAAEQLLLYRNGIDFADKWGSSTELETNGSAASNVTGWNGYTDGAGAVAWDNTQGANGTGQSAASAVTAAIYNYVYSPVFTITQGKKYRVSVWAKIDDTSNLNNDGVAMIKVADDSAIKNQTLTLLRGTANLITSLTTSFQQWVFEFTADQTTSVVRVYFRSRKTGAANWQLNVDEVSLIEIGALASYESEGIQPSPGQVLDSSTNKLHAMQPASGSKEVRPMREFEVRWTNTWAGTHEAQYIGGVNQAVLPANAYLTQIIGVVTGGTIEDIIIGDGSDTDHWVAITTGLAAGTTAFTIANPISDGTNYKLVVDPDANFTGSIAFTVKGFILQ